MMDCGHCGSDQIVMIEGVYICKDCGKTYSSADAEQRTLALEGNAQEGGLSARPLRKTQVIDEEQRRKAYVRRVFRVHVLPWLG